ncbi:chorismate-binding protein [Planosporangium sp. 12N6]|uniref:chorismate-binding protein n=1 Tax=Planosporangium spinosum TaxID=3402278 RepID=UPI003CEC2A91
MRTPGAVSPERSGEVTRPEHLGEVARLEWWLADGGDPAELIAGFLDTYGLRHEDLGDAGRRAGSGRVTGPAGADGYRAVLFVSAAAGARMVDHAGPPSPAPAVPDVVIVVYGPRAGTGRTPAHPVRPGPWRLDPWRPSWTPQSHAGAVSAVREAIARGDVYQVNLVGHQSAGYGGDPLPALRRVAALPGARYGGVLTGDGWALACASPEILFSVADGRIVTGPIKGTRPATDAGRRELLTSTKERAEHVMIVDLERNDLARVAATGSVRVDELYAIRRWCGLWQAESVVSARLAAGVGLADVLRVMCPGGSVTGAPKLAALDVIADLEPVGRGPSMGAYGWVTRDGIDLGLTIRTVAVDAERVHVWAGGGITWGSDPEAEVAEAAAKAAPLRAALAATRDRKSP